MTSSHSLTCLLVLILRIRNVWESIRALLLQSQKSPDWFLNGYGRIEKSMDGLISKRKLKTHYFRVDNAIFEYTRGTFSPSTVALVYFFLARKVDNDTQVCYPSQETIAKNVGLSRVQVNRAIQALFKRQIIAISVIQGRHNVYLLRDRSEWSKIELDVTKKYRGSKSKLREYVAAGYTINTPNQNSNDKRDFFEKKRKIALEKKISHAYT